MSDTSAPHTAADTELPFDSSRFDYSPWWFWREADEEQRQRQLERRLA